MLEFAISSVDRAQFPTKGDPSAIKQFRQPSLKISRTFPNFTTPEVPWNVGDTRWKLYKLPDRFLGTGCCVNNFYCGLALGRWESKVPKGPRRGRTTVEPEAHLGADIVVLLWRACPNTIQVLSPAISTSPRRPTSLFILGASTMNLWRRKSKMCSFWKSQVSGNGHVTTLHLQFTAKNGLPFWFVKINNTSTLFQFISHSIILQIDASIQFRTTILLTLLDTLTEIKLFNPSTYNQHNPVTPG